MTLQVFDLGATGTSPASKVAELTDFLNEVARLPTGKTVFSLGEDKRGTAIKYLAVIRKCDWAASCQTIAVCGQHMRWWLTRMACAIAEPDDILCTFHLQTCMQRNSTVLWLVVDSSAIADMQLWLSLGKCI